MPEQSVSVELVKRLRQQLEVGANADGSVNLNREIATEAADLIEKQGEALGEIAANQYFFCNKCGYDGTEGPQHAGCRYEAAESGPSRIARAALSQTTGGGENG